jgi:putative addiction module antidote
MSSLKIRKIGNSLGVILPKEIQDSLEVVEGDLIEFTKIDNNKILLESSLPHHSQWKFKGVGDLTKEDQDWLDADLEDGANVQKW